jgi:hypothetical protein
MFTLPGREDLCLRRDFPGPKEEHCKEIRKVFPARNTSALGMFTLLAGDISALGEIFPVPEWKITGNLKISEMQEGLISDIPGFLTGHEDYSFTFFTVF